MKGNDPSFVEATRLVKKFFPESKSFDSPEIGLDWDAFLGAMMVANYEADHSCNPFRNPSDPDLGLSDKGGLSGDDSEIYLRLLSHAKMFPSGRAVVILDAIGTHVWSVEECPPFTCDSQKVPERLRKVGCFGQSHDTIFVFESGEALLVDHDKRVHWARSKVNLQWLNACEKLVGQEIGIVTRGQDDDGPDYDLVCPSCSSRCVGKTRRALSNCGTYRNVYVNYDVWRVICTHCGLVQEMSRGGSLQHRYWYRIKIGDDILWAENESRLRQIRDMLAGSADRNESDLYALPKWLLTKTNRKKAVRQIDQMLTDPGLRRICDA